MIALDTFVIAGAVAVGGMGLWCVKQMVDLGRTFDRLVKEDEVKDELAETRTLEWRRKRAAIERADRQLEAAS